MGVGDRGSGLGFVLVILAGFVNLNYRVRVTVWVGVAVRVIMRSHPGLIIRH